MKSHPLENIISAQPIKHFIYFQSCEGGMQEFDVLHEENLRSLLGWMEEAYGCKKQDLKLLNWMKTAEVGEKFDHRLGIIVRLKDKQP